MYTFARLSREDLDRVQAAEQELGVRLLALTDVTLEPAPVDAAQVTAIQDIEEELGICLLAVR